MYCGQASEVNSAGTRCSAFARMGAAANLTGISNSESGSSGSACCSSPEAAIFFVLLQERKKTIRKKQGRYFNGYLIVTITNEYNIPHDKVEVFYPLFCSAPEEELPREHGVFIVAIQILKVNLTD
jgi:hypothetical protein